MAQRIPVALEAEVVVKPRPEAIFVATYVAGSGTANGVFFLTAALSIVETDDYVALALQGLAQAAPPVVLAALLGVIRRRVSFRQLLPYLMWVEAFICVLFGVYGLLFGYSLALALVLGLVVGTTSNAQAPGRQSLFADLFARETRRRALSNLSTAGNVSRLLAPALAGLTLASNAWWIWFVLHGAVLAGAGASGKLTIRRLGVSPASREPGEQRRGVDGRAYLLFVPFAILCTFGFNIQILSPVIASAKIVDVATAGVIVSTHAAGAMLGTFLVGRVSSSLSTVFPLGCVILGIGLASVPLAPGLLPILLLLFGAGLGRGAALNSSSVMSTTFTEDAQEREHVVALISITFSASNLVSAPLVALLLSAGGLTLAMVVCGAGCALAAVTWWLWGSHWWEGQGRFESVSK